MAAYRWKYSAIAASPTSPTSPIPLSLGPHAFYWFHLQPRETAESLNIGTTSETPLTLRVDSLEEVFSEATLRTVKRVAPRMLPKRAWFLGKGRTITAVNVHDIVALPETAAHLLFLDVDYADADTETYLVPLSVAIGEKAETILRERPESVLARLTVFQNIRRPCCLAQLPTATSATLCCAPSFAANAFGVLAAKSSARTRATFARPGYRFARISNPVPYRGSMPFTEIDYGDDFLLKIYRKLEGGSRTRAARFPSS